MNPILEELESVPGVMGSYIFNPKEGIVDKHMPPVFKDPKLIEAGKLLVKIHNTSRSNFSNLIDTSFFFEEAIVIIRESSNNFFLIVLFEPSMNLNMLTVSLNLVMDDMKEFAENWQKPLATDPVSAAQSPAPLPDTGKKLSAAELLNSSPMAESLQGMQLALTKVIGPMAKIIFNDSLNEWLNTSQPSSATISALTDILCKEIGDPDKIAAYKEKIAVYTKPGNI